VAPLLVLRSSLIGKAEGESDGPRRGTAEALALWPATVSASILRLIGTLGRAPTMANQADRTPTCVLVADRHSKAVERRANRIP